MKLRNKLYSILSRDIAESNNRYDIKLDPNHWIYKAHFPEEPVTPGVFIIQTAKELLEDYIGHELSIQSIKNVKFMNVISPIVIQQVTFVIEKIMTDGGIYTAIILVLSPQDDTMLAKLSFTCIQK